MAEIGHWNACINRLYYACFYAVNALLITRNLSSSKHSGVRGLFNKYFIKTGEISNHFGKLYNTLFVYRQQSDYEDFFKMEEATAGPKIAQTREFLEAIEKLLPNSKQQET